MENKKELGIYIHIPFCIKKCNYCDFLSAPAKQQVQKYYTDSLISQIMQYESLINKYQVKTIFFGGGTPSILNIKEMERIIEAIYQISVAVDTLNEITIEANPGTLSKEKLNVYKKLGFNRLSIGLQSADNEELKLLGRIHTYEEFLKNYFDARECGFQNINIDLMTGLPKQTLEKAENTLEKIVKLNPEHISAYSLIIEEGTPFYEWYYKKEYLLPDEETERNIYYKTKEILKQNGYNRYEISNYSKLGYESSHNLSYWSGTDYLGLGLGASSYINGVRFTMEKDLEMYCKEAIEGKSLERDRVVLTENEQMEEFMFLGLRKTKGICKREFEEQFQYSIDKLYGIVLERLSANELIVNDTEWVYLTDYGIDVSNQVLAEFLLDET